MNIDVNFTVKIVIIFFEIENLIHKLSFNVLSMQFPSVKFISIFFIFMATFLILVFLFKTQAL